MPIGYIVPNYIPFIYSDKQIINIVHDNEFYELKFKLYSDIYFIKDNRPLFLYKEGVKLLLLNCEEDSNIIRCYIKKDELFKILSFNGEKFYLYTIAEYEGVLELFYGFWRRREKLR